MKHKEKNKLVPYLIFQLQRQFLQRSGYQILFFFSDRTFEGKYNL